VDKALNPAQLEFLAELRAYLDGLEPELVAATRAENIADPMQPREHGRRFLRRLGADGWLGISWPREYGGQGRDPVEQWLFAEELRQLTAWAAAEGLLTGDTASHRYLSSPPRYR
jgi:hypothetical protein